MGIDNYITDPLNHKNAHVVTHNDKNNKNALVVATHPLKIYENQLQFFTSDTYGIDMNLGRTIVYTENINDGTDNPYWTASIISGGKWTINSTDQNHTALGSQSIKSDKNDLNAVLQIDKGSNLVLTNYDFLSMWIYVDKDWVVGDSIEVYGWNTGTGTIVGNRVKLEDYFSFSTFDVWQSFPIPLSDMALTGKTLDSIRIEITAKDGKSPKFYIDDIKFEGLGDDIIPGEFFIEPELGTWLHVSIISFSIADNITGVIADGTMPGLSYNKLLGESALSNGIRYQRIQDGEVLQTLIIKQLSDYLQLPSASISTNISDGTNTFINISSIFIEPLILKAEDNDQLKITISDNLSGLLHLRAVVGAKLERRQ